MIVKTVGRRKCSVALVKLIRGEGTITVNEKIFTEYFQNNPNYDLYHTLENSIKLN
jgi:ribosomal protein S9